MAELVGKTLGRYHILEQLGEGGMATVFRAYDTRLERDVAVKVIRREAFPAEMYDQMLKRFEREAKSLAKLSHPNIVKVHDYGEYEGSPFLVLEFLPGGTLKDRLTSQPMPWQNAIQLLLPIARALQFAHDQGIIHRDIKPANILITSSGEPMLSDFGIAKILENAGTTALTGTGVGMGTPEYMAPEQWIGETSPASDLYSLGVVLFEMLTGKKPYHADTPAAILLKQATEPLPRPKGIVYDLPDEVERVLIKALSKEPDNRYASVGALMAVLERLLTQTPAQPVEMVTLPPVTVATPAPIAGTASTPPAQPPPPASRSSWQKYAGVGIIFILILFGAFFVNRLGRHTPSAPPTSVIVATSTSAIIPTELPPSATFFPTETPIPTETPSPTARPQIVARRPSLSEAEQGINLSIWRANSIDPGDMPSPGTRSFSGSVNVGQKYLWTFKWCTLGRAVLDDNLRHITHTYTINTVAVPQAEMYEYYGDESGWSCYYWMTLLEGWHSGEQVTLRAIRVFDTEINDGQSSYPTGAYITELVVTVK